MTIVTMLKSWLPEATPDCSPVPANWPTMMRSAAPYMAWRNSASSTGNAKEIKGITAQLCLRPSPNLLPHPCSYKRGKYIQYSRPFITFV